MGDGVRAARGWSIDEFVEAVVRALPDEEALECSNDDIVGVIELYDFKTIGKLGETLVTAKGSDAAYELEDALLMVAPEAFLVKLEELLAQNLKELAVAAKKREQVEKEAAEQRAAQARAQQEEEAAQNAAAKAKAEKQQAAQLLQQKLEEDARRKAEESALRQRVLAEDGGKSDSLAAKVSHRRLQRSKGKASNKLKHSDPDATYLADDSTGGAAFALRKDSHFEANVERRREEEHRRNNFNLWLQQVATAGGRVHKPLDHPEFMVR